MSMYPLILIADDDPVVHESLGMYLGSEGYEHQSAYDGQQALEMFESLHPDLMVLDLMMPKVSGLDVCRQIRQNSSMPIIMLTAKGEEIDRILGLELGADDYIVKPLEMREVVARVRAVLRRLSPDDSGKLTFDGLTIDKQAYELIINGKRVDAPPKEIELLYFLAQSPNRVFTRAQLLDDVWGFDYFGDTRTVDVHVKRLREKLEGVSDKWELKTVWGVGYKFETKN